MTNELLTPYEVASIIHVKVNTLSTWRSNRSQNLSFVKIGSRVFYKQSDVEAFIERNTTTSTN